MSRISIITDSDASLPALVAAQHGIVQVPITVHFGQETLRTGIEIDDARLFARVDREGKLPTTSAPAPGQFVEAYQAAFAAGAEEIICLCVSSEVSATYNAALTAADQLAASTKISVVDTRTLSLAQGFMVLAAAEAVQSGATREAAIAHARSAGERSHLYGALSTLKYLAMSGRVGYVAAGFAGLLNVKPVLTVRNGKLDMLERQRARSRSLARVIELTGQVLGGKQPERMGIIHVNIPDEARQFEAQVRAALPCPETILTAELSAGLSVHSGAGLLGLVVVTAA